MAYETLLVLAEEGFAQELPPRARDALILLLIALEAWYQGCGHDYLGDLNALLKDLTSGKNPPPCLGEVLEKMEAALNHLLPSHYVNTPKSPQKALRHYLGSRKMGYRVRDLWREMLRRLDLHVPTPPCPKPGTPPPVPEFLLGLLPVPAMHHALMRILSKIHRVARKDLEASLSALFVYRFIHSATCPEEWHPLLFKADGTLDAGYEGGYAWLAKGGTLVEAEGTRLRVYLNEQDQTLASPKLKDILPSWYAVADVSLEDFLKHCKNVFRDPQGYDWDLVEEYHEAFLEALRDGVCPRFFAPRPHTEAEGAERGEA